jgi:hypothetical protein
MEREPLAIGYFTSACIGALGAGVLIVTGWHAMDSALRRWRRAMGSA